MTVVGILVVSKNPHWLLLSFYSLREYKNAVGIVVPTAYGYKQYNILADNLSQNIQFCN